MCTVVTHERRGLFGSGLARRCLHRAIAKVGVNRPFEIEELVLLPDHFHLILALPDGDPDFSSRIGGIKSTFTRLYLEAGGTDVDQSDSRSDHRYRGIWQKRFWEHHLREADDLRDCRMYCWCNPVKHGLVRCPHDWPYSTFHRAVGRGWIERTWCCACAGDAAPPKIRAVAGVEME
jgi:putative transposase